MDLSHDYISASVESILRSCRSQDSQILVSSFSGYDFEGNTSVACSITSSQSPLRQCLKREKQNLEEEINGIRLRNGDSQKPLHLKELELLRLKAVLAPIRMIPTEILCRILALLAPQRLPDDLDANSRLLQVCRQWRSMVYDMPEMWSNIQIITDDSSEQHCQCLTRHLNKARLTGLNFILQAGDDRQAGSRELVREVLGLSPFWRSFQYRSVPGQIFHAHELAVLDSLRNAGSLRELTLSNCWENVPDQATFSLSSVRTVNLEYGCLPAGIILPNAAELNCWNPNVSAAAVRNWSEQFPKLRLMQLNGTELTFRAENPDTGWDSLLDSPPKFPFMEEMFISCVPPLNRLPACLAIMAGSPNLCTLRIFSGALYDLDKLPFRKAKMPQLRTLIIKVTTRIEGQDTRFPLAFLRLLSGVDVLEMQLGRQARVLLTFRISCLISRGCDLFPRIRRLSLTFDDMGECSEEELSAWMHSWIKVIGIEECWSEINDIIHEIYEYYRMNGVALYRDDPNASYP